MKAYKGILCKVLKKFRLNHLFYRMLSAIYSSERVELPSYEESERLLSIVCPDNGKSCVTAKNSIKRLRIMHTLPCTALTGSSG